VVTPAGRVVSSYLSSPPATMVETNPYAGQPASAGGDLCLDPLSDGGNLCTVAGTSSSPYGDSYTVTFAGGPTLVSSVYYVNRVGSPYATRITSGNGSLTLLSPNGAAVTHAISSSGTISEFAFSPSLAPVYPSPSDPNQASATYRSLWVRYVHVAAAPGACLAFKELWLLDASFTNVALRKNVTASPQAAGAAATNGNDGLIQYDDTTLTYVTQDAACNGSGFWEVDLGGVYNAAQLLVFNRYATASALNGAVVTLLNYGRWPVGSIVLNANAVQNYTVALFPPSPSITPTPSTTPTSSGTATPSASLSPGTSISSSGTPTPSASVTASTTPSATPTASVSPSPQYPYQISVLTHAGSALNFYVRRAGGGVGAGRTENGHRCAVRHGSRVTGPSHLPLPFVRVPTGAHRHDALRQDRLHVVRGGARWL
jgi:hypothetical protein